MNITESDRSRFFENVDVGEPDECWLWKAATTGEGYGSMWVGDASETAHRLSYLIHFGCPGENYVLHDCDNPPCVNPRHLHLGTHGDNIKEAYDRGLKHPATPVGEKHANSKLTEDDVREIRARYENESVTQKELADAFDIKRPAVSKIVNRKSWKHVDADGDDV